MDLVDSKAPIDEPTEEPTITNTSSDVVEGQQALEAATPRASNLAKTEDTEQEWEDDLLAAVEGRRALADDQSQMNDDGSLPSTPATPGPQNITEHPSPTSNHSKLDEIPKAKKAAVNRTVSIKYTPTEKFWLNRMYRLYRHQQAAQKEAKDNKGAYKPTGGLLTHARLMASFNNRFEGKYVDGCVKPRPARLQHSFGLWSTKNVRKDTEHMIGNIPNYWTIDKKGSKPANISLDEHTKDIWDNDQYLGITTNAPAELVPTPQKRKAAIEVEEVDSNQSKKVKVEDDDAKETGAADDDGEPSVFNGLYKQCWSHRQRRYSAPAVSTPSEFEHLRQFNGDFDYSWLREQAQLRQG